MLPIIRRPTAEVRLMTVVKKVKDLLAHPLARGVDIDDPALTLVRRRIIREKPFLQEIYAEWYRWIAASLPAIGGPVLELGPGPGFLAEQIPGLVTSDVFACEGVQRVIDARRIPYGDAELRAIVMTDVLHYIPDAAAFFREGQRCLRPEGAVLMVEPWNTPLARLVWTRLHHEPFEPEAAAWEFPASGPLSAANTALPWIVFSRDRERFAREFPMLSIESVEPCMPLRYVVSGGISMRSLMPGWATGSWRGIEAALEPLRDRLGMFAKITVRRL